MLGVRLQPPSGRAPSGGLNRKIFKPWKKAVEGRLLVTATQDRRNTVGGVSIKNSHRREAFIAKPDFRSNLLTDGNEPVSCRSLHQVRMFVQGPLCFRVNVPRINCHSEVSEPRITFLTDARNQEKFREAANHALHDERACLAELIAGTNEIIDVDERTFLELLGRIVNTERITSIKH